MKSVNQRGQSLVEFALTIGLASPHPEATKEVATWANVDAAWAPFIIGQAANASAGSDTKPGRPSQAKDLPRLARYSR
jgi:hypothetical protein